LTTSEGVGYCGFGVATYSKYAVYRVVSLCMSVTVFDRDKVL